MKKILAVFMLIIAGAGFMGCTTTQKGTGVGALTGAALGGIIGHQSGKTTEGALIGAAVGGAGGYVVGENIKAKFCPVCGRHFDESVVYCPYDGTELQYRQK